MKGYRWIDGHVVSKSTGELIHCAAATLLGQSKDAPREGGDVDFGAAFCIG